MQFYDQLPRLLAGTALTTAVVIMLPQTAFALSGRQVNEIAREVTVLFQGTRGQHGSGVIIAKSDQTYYVLTAHHVVKREDDYKLVTADKQAYAIDYAKIKPLPGVDLAVVEFSSEEDYQVAQLANSELASQGQEVFISGWPALGVVGREAGGQLIRQFTDGQISGFLEKPFIGYQMIYTNITRAGMSGGPVLDAGGRVIGIHGLGDKEDPNKFAREGFSPEEAAGIANKIKPGFNYAIPINSFFQLAPQAGIFLSLQVENSQAPELGEPYVASAEPDPRDTIDDINKTLNTVGNVINTVDRIRNFFR